MESIKNEISGNNNCVAQFETHTVVDNAVHNHLQKQIDELRKNNTVKSGVNTALEITIVFLIVILIITTTYGG